VIKIEGLGELTWEMRAFEKAVASMDGKLGTVQFDPADAGSIERAIIEVDAMVDQKVAEYPNNSMIAGLGTAMKENLRAQIIEKAAHLRAERNNES